MTTATAKGHLDQERRNFQSTKVNITQYSGNTFPVKTSSKNHNCFTTITPAPQKEMIYSDQTGWFPYQSSQGTHYIYVVCNYDESSILHAPLKSQKTEHITAA